MLRRPDFADCVRRRSCGAPAFCKDQRRSQSTHTYHRFDAVVCWAGGPLPTKKNICVRSRFGLSPTSSDTNVQNFNATNRGCLHISKTIHFVSLERWQCAVPRRAFFFSQVTRGCRANAGTAHQGSCTFPVFSVDYCLFGGARDLHLALRVSL